MRAYLIQHILPQNNRPQTRRRRSFTHSNNPYFSFPFSVVVVVVVLLLLVLLLLVLLLLLFVTMMRL